MVMNAAVLEKEPTGNRAKPSTVGKLLTHWLINKYGEIPEDVVAYDFEKKELAHKLFKRNYIYQCKKVKSTHDNSRVIIICGETNYVADIKGITTISSETMDLHKTFVHLTWLGHAKMDKSCLWMLQPSCMKRLPGIISIDDEAFILSRPLVYCEDSKNVTWLLNFHEPYVLTPHKFLE